jgi:hypothetical protein
MNAYGKPSLLQSALIGGAVMAVFDLPLLGVVNCCCCAGVIAGGFVAAWVYSSKLPAGYVFLASDGASVGALAGIFGALFGGVVWTLYTVADQSLSGDFKHQILREMQRSGRQMPAEMRDLVERLLDTFTGPSGMVLLLLGSLIVLLVVKVLFGAIGGLIGSAVFGKQARPPAPAA